MVLIGLSLLAPVLDITTWTFAIESLPLNLYFSYLGWRFYKEGDSKSSRKLFRFSLIHIPILLLLMFISKKTFGDGAKKVPSGIFDTGTICSSNVSAKDSIHKASSSSS